MSLGDHLGRRPELVLLPSPLLGAGAWAGAAAALRQAGWATTVSEVPARPSTVDEVARRFLDDLPSDRSLVLVPHSNAGLFVPRLSEQRDVVATVFVDAALPPVAGDFPIAPPSLVARVEATADADGLLPPWTRWWEEDAVDALFPGPAARRRVEATQPRVSLSYLRSTLHAPTGWSERPSAYLGFGDTYAAEVEQAQRWGWPVEALTGRHLHQLVQPEQVAERVTALLERLGVRG